VVYDRAMLGITSKQVVAQDDRTGYSLLLLSLLIFSSSPCAYFYLNRKDPVIFSQCNVVCSSNIVGFVFVALHYRKQLTIETLRSVSSFDWGWLLFGCLFYSVLAPFFFLTGLDTVSIADAAILSRLESINILVLSYLFLGKAHPTKISAWATLNSLLTLGGVVLTLTAPLFWGEAADFSRGNVLIVLSGWANTISLTISIKNLTSIPLGIIAITRVALGTFAFHFLVVIMGDPGMNLSSPQLWMYMVPFSIIYVYIGQVVWLMTLSRVTPLTISVGTTFLFTLTMLWSVVLLKILPDRAQMLGAGVITISIASSVAEKIHSARQVPLHKQEVMDNYTLLQDDGEEGDGDGDGESEKRRIASTWSEPSFNYDRFNSASFDATGSEVVYRGF